MPSVLIVDDSAVDRRLAGGILEKALNCKIDYAANGSEALEKIASGSPDVVLTDLQMPEIDGLQMVGEIRTRFPLVPVVLMTAHGSENIAVEALQRGAASYVSKTRLKQDLPEVVETVLSVVRTHRDQSRLADCVTRTSSEFVLPNDPSMVCLLVDYCQELVTRMNLCDETGRIRIGIALEEAVLNAMLHGNLELSSEALREARQESPCAGKGALAERAEQKPYCDRRVFIQVSADAEAARFVIRDEGPGFDPAEVPDPTDPANLERESGRGLLLMRAFMDIVEFNAAGNEVTLVKLRNGKQ